MQFFDNEIVRSEAAEMMQTYEDVVDLMGSAKFKTQEGLNTYLVKISRMSVSMSGKNRSENIENCRKVWGDKSSPIQHERSQQCNSRTVAFSLL